MSAGFQSANFFMLPVCTYLRRLFGIPSPVTAIEFAFPLVSTTRTAENWLDGVSAEQQEGIVTFGAVRAYTDGTPVVSMSGYHKLISRAETQKVVEYIRTQLTPVIAEIGKTK